MESLLRSCRKEEELQLEAACTGVKADNFPSLGQDQGSLPVRRGGELFTLALVSLLAESPATEKKRERERGGDYTRFRLISQRVPTRSGRYLNNAILFLGASLYRSGVPQPLFYDKSRHAPCC
ncbi:uncharacterized protein LOC143218852 [Lasioglossum baleicum]|uniref:uncharacterized protein LOC143218852 n=1 Tax=Lasioglossum baleicum TaxID=434251 RepID=UPI003FCCDFB3